MKVFTVIAGPTINDDAGGVVMAVESSTEEKYAFLFTDTHMCGLTPKGGKMCLARLDKGVWEITEVEGTADAVPAKPALVLLLNFAKQKAEPYVTTWKLNRGGVAHLV